MFSPPNGRSAHYCHLDSQMTSYPTAALLFPENSFGSLHAGPSIEFSFESDVFYPQELSIEVNSQFENYAAYPRPVIDQPDEKDDVIKRRLSANSMEGGDMSNSLNCSIEEAKVHTPSIQNHMLENTEHQPMDNQLQSVMEYGGFENTYNYDDNFLLDFPNLTAPVPSDSTIYVAPENIQPPRANEIAAYPRRKTPIRGGSGIIRSKFKVRPKLEIPFVNTCGHGKDKLLVVPTLDKTGHWVSANYVCQTCGWINTCTSASELHAYKELIGDKLNPKVSGGFQRKRPQVYPAKEPATKATEKLQKLRIPPNQECNSEKVETGNYLLHQTGHTRGVALVDPVPRLSSSSPPKENNQAEKAETVTTTTYICELCLRIEGTLWDITNHRDAIHRGIPVKFLEFTSPEKDTTRLRCNSLPEKIFLMQPQYPVVNSGNSEGPPFF